MAPPRQPRATEDLLPNGANTRHIHAREKDILNKTLGGTGVSKSKKISNPSKTPNANSSTLAASNNGSRNATPAGPNTIPRPIWRAGPGSSEQRMKWSSMPLSTLNKWRTHLNIPLSAPFSTESARLSLQHPDGLGELSITMSGPLIRRPRPRNEVEIAIAEAFENSPVDEDEVVAVFLAKQEEEKRISGRGAGAVAAGISSASVFGSGGGVSKPVRCRSDMLS